VTAAGHHTLVREIGALARSLPEDVPVFIQAMDTTLEAVLPPDPDTHRFIGFDPVFIGAGTIATLVAAPDLSDGVRANAERFVGALGRNPVWIADSPGLVAPRVVSMLINEAAFAFMDGVADKETIDLAMQTGVNYPHGLFEWGEMIGWERVLAILELLQREFGEDRYRPCQRIRRWARQAARSAAWRDLA
jgi:3-hydroxybutyryl-CoA dehydrogenase